jgi:hypothetical protein
MLMAEQHDIDPPKLTGLNGRTLQLVQRLSRQLVHRAGRIESGIREHAQAPPPQ